MFIEEALAAAGGTVTEAVRLPASPPVYGPIPDGLHPSVKSQLGNRFPQGIFAHQAKAIELAVRGDCVCIATPTASGKTLVFTTYAASRLLQSPGSVVLALYPARALIQDQLARWQEAAAGLDIAVGIIDGGVTSMQERSRLLSECRVVLMTPDVLHAWLMANLAEAVVRQFVGALDLVILDEAHVYDGVFGTNMAYLLRRLRAASGVSQFLAGSATVGAPAELLQKLTGLPFTALGADDDGAGRAEKEVLLCTLSPRRASQFLRQLVAKYEGRPDARFLVFADSRKRVEEIAAEQRGQPDAADAPEATGDPAVDDDVIEAENLVQPRVLPYRAGYEEEDRRQIQKALGNGTLIGVITTSALELGIDIGEIETAVLLGSPSSVKSFWQRAGRAGRRKPGYVALVDLDGRVSAIGLGRYLERAPEPNWLYLDNEYLQYANALCAAEERQESITALYSPEPFSTLPTAFAELLDNELQPTRPIPPDLYPLKQQAQIGPHRAFPVRTGIEKSYSVNCRQLPGQRLGSLTYAQLLREAFPGAIYRYLAKPYRVFELKHYNGEVVTAKMSGFGRTSPIVQTAVFPQLGAQIYHLRRSDIAWIAECHLQVSERVVGFVERWGNRTSEHRYEPGSPYAQKPLNRYVDTSGVCFYFPDEELQREGLGKYLALAFCRLCSVQERDIGWGTFVSQVSPWSPGAVRGFAVYDSAFGSLRLTRQIPERLEAILEEAIRLADEERANRIATGLRAVQAALASLAVEQIGAQLVGSILGPATAGDWIRVIAADQPAILHDGQAHQNEEVTVLRYLYTPQGIRYVLRPPRVGVEWSVLAAMVRPIPGLTRVEEYNVNTGEVRQTA